MEHTLDYIFTKDSKQRKQYYRLRKLIYASELGFYLDTLEDPCDAGSNILVVMDQGRCVGGVRLTVASADKGQLPMEDAAFQLKELFPELNYPGVVYGELSRLILLPGYRDGKVTEKIYRRIYQKCRQLGVGYLFAITPRVQARRYLLNAKYMGFSARIAPTPIPTYKKEAYAGLAECLVVLEETKRSGVGMPAEERKEGTVVSLEV